MEIKFSWHFFRSVLNLSDSFSFCRHPNEKQHSSITFRLAHTAADRLVLQDQSLIWASFVVVVVVSSINFQPDWVLNTFAVLLQGFYPEKCFHIPVKTCYQPEKWLYQKQTCFFLIVSEKKVKKILFTFCFLYNESPALLNTGYFLFLFLFSTLSFTAFSFMSWFTLFLDV